jgi:hypothetical protein
MMDKLPQVLRVAADSQSHFAMTPTLDLQPAKFNIQVKGVSHEHARELIEKCIDSEDYLTCLRPLLDDAFGCIQADGLRVAGVPIGSEAFITNYVRSKALDIVQDVDKLDIMKDPLTKYRFLKCCQQSRLDFLGRNVSPSKMPTPVNGIVGPQHWAVIQAILKVGTAGQFDTLQPDMKKWCASPMLAQDYGEDDSSIGTKAV